MVHSVNMPLGVQDIHMGSLTITILKQIPKISQNNKT